MGAISPQPTREKTSFERSSPSLAAIGVAADVTMRYWRPQVAGQRALLMGYSGRAATFCSGYRVVARISAADDSDESGRPIPR